IWQSVLTAEKIYDVREKIGNLISCQPQNIAFTQNCTVALNMAIKGSVKKGDHIIISCLEHNAVSRPVEALAQKGVIAYDIAMLGNDNEETVNNFKKLIRKNTSLIVCMHASNVFGCVFPIREIGRLCKEKGIRFIVDGAQSVGVMPVSRESDNIGILCAPGHKGLYGPMGTGFMAVGDDIELDTIIEGGTGSSSMDLNQPSFLPDRFESGTLNNSGILGLGAGVDFVRSKGVENIYNHELRHIQMIYKELSKNDKVTLYTPFPQRSEYAPILSFNFSDYQSEKTASLLAEKGIAVRAGLHCAPLAHRAFNTIDRGTVRISPSVFTTVRECEIFINSLKKL
ncbi:MAG: aminotransferase class V-fold PLP-dependent enzyme, partial [Eubacterium sp.]